LKTTYLLTRWTGQTGLAIVAVSFKCIAAAFGADLSRL
jgi:hypothetical protein